MDELLTRLGIADRRRDIANTLSGGLKRRVEIAKSLLHSPRVLLLDEPGTGLDPGARRDLSSHLRTLCDEQGVTVILTTHITDEAERADRLAILDAGRVVVHGPPDRLKDDIGGDCVTITSRDPGGLASLIAERFGATPTVVDQQIRIERDRGHELVTQLVEAFPGEVQSVTVSKPTLEDVFIHHTGHRLWAHEAPEGTA